MSGRVVCDASALVALLLDDGPDGSWVARRLAGNELAAPALVDYEVANLIRRFELATRISADLAMQAHADLCDLAIERWPYELVARRAFELRRNLTVYDATYVALAELLDAPLVSLDRRIAGASGVGCTVLVP